MSVRAWLWKPAERKTCLTSRLAPMQQAKPVGGSGDDND
eukprot:CAMPEP_0204515726 /NCGR_PEP_ID=MMETSP0661-20131031/2772_1 /ASSEMBLY_ACC=CAM_ASM_000606 /TAXON_ID=109239 /ORGANISM="Alexandrium margalefi, Strain AMGDE01CS-322" /LENGTH=38 /DNA_ID= /DNA_START= /DNA_END= /DNA_ORIENTATION=